MEEEIKKFHPIHECRQFAPEGWDCEDKVPITANMQNHAFPKTAKEKRKKGMAALERGLDLKLKVFENVAFNSLSEKYETSMKSG